MEKPKLVLGQEHLWRVDGRLRLRIEVIAYPVCATMLRGSYRKVSGRRDRLITTIAIRSMIAGATFATQQQAKTQ
jgi:hypothetical protein